MTDQTRSDAYADAWLAELEAMTPQERAARTLSQGDDWLPYEETWWFLARDVLALSARVAELEEASRE